MQTILIVDDEAPIRMVVGAKLRGAGFHVLEGCDGEEGLHLARQNLPDLIVTDLQMPHMSGIEMCTHLRIDAKTAGIPAILLTARGYVLTDEQVQKTIVRRLMSKPFSAREVLENAQSILASPEAA